MGKTEGMRVVALVREPVYPGYLIYLIVHNEDQVRKKLVCRHE